MSINRGTTPVEDKIISLLQKPLSDALTHKYGKLSLSLLYQAKSVTDGSTVLLVKDEAGHRRAVVLCSASTSPNMISRAILRSKDAKRLLNIASGNHILDPIFEGRIQERSFAVMPHCESLSNIRPVWWLQRWALRKPLLGWLQSVTAQTARVVPGDDSLLNFARPLEFISSLKVMNQEIKSSAIHAKRRLLERKWTPSYVLMLGDFWKGNILIGPTADFPATGTRWHERFVIIDWPGSITQGYAMFDLIRIAQSFRLSRTELKKEIEKHCRILRCDESDAISYLLTALGHIGENLENFPPESYARMATSCYATLTRALPRT